MISVCSVTLDGLLPYLDIFIESLSKNKLVKELLIAKVDSDKNYLQTSQIGDLKVVVFGHPITTSLDYGHALGLHGAIDRTNEEYVWVSDPDVFFYPDTDDFYLQMTEKYNLNIIGVSHHNALGLAWGFFCNIINFLIKKDRLPDKNWLKGTLKHGRDLVVNFDEDASKLCDADGLYLIQGAIPELYKKWPNAGDRILYDIGANLWLWNEEKQGRWMSFPTFDTHFYSSSIYKTNFKLKDPLEKRKLIYHQTNGTRAKEEGFNMFKKMYRKENG